MSLFRFDCVVKVEADDLEDALILLWQRMGYSNDWDLPELRADREDGNDEVEVDVRPAILAVADHLSDRDPRTCPRDPCCEGMLRFGHTPICQLGDEGTAKLAELQAKLAGAAEAEER